MVLLDEDRLKALYPKVDMECLRRQSALFEQKGVPQPDLPTEEKYRWLTAAKSACLQVSPSHPGLMSPQSANMEEEFERLFYSLILT